MSFTNIMAPRHLEVVFITQMYSVMLRSLVWTGCVEPLGLRLFQKLVSCSLLADFFQTFKKTNSWLTIVFDQFWFFNVSYWSWTSLHFRYVQFEKGSIYTNIFFNNASWITNIGYDKPSVNMMWACHESHDKLFPLSSKSAYRGSSHKTICCKVGGRRQCTDSCCVCVNRDCSEDPCEPRRKSAALWQYKKSKRIGPTLVTWVFTSNTHSIFTGKCILCKSSPSAPTWVWKLTNLKPDAPISSGGKSSFLQLRQTAKAKPFLSPHHLQTLCFYRELFRLLQCALLWAQPVVTCPTTAG